MIFRRRVSSIQASSIPRTWHRLKKLTATYALALCAAGFTQSAIAESDNNNRIYHARGLHVAWIDLDSSHEMAHFSIAEQRALAESFVPTVLAAHQAKPDRLVTIFVRGAFLAYDRMNHNRRRHYRTNGGWNETEARIAHETAMKRFLNTLIREAKAADPTLRVAVYGLPVEAEGISEGVASQVNERYDRVIERLDALVTSREFIVDGGSEFNAFRNGTPQAHNYRNDRAIFFKNSNQWRVAYAGSDDASDHHEGRGFGNYDFDEDQYRDNSNGGQGSGSNDDRMPIFATDQEHKEYLKSRTQGGDNDQQQTDQTPTYDFFWAGKGVEIGQVNLDNTPLIQDRLVIFYERELGHYPCIKDGNYVNGGLPQLMDLQAHLDQLEEDIAELIPNANWDGFAVIDYEAHELLWSRTKEIYRQASRDLVRDRHWTLPDHEIEAIAANEYEQATRDLMEQTILRCQQLRPDAKWGFWGIGRNYQEQYYQYDWVWAVSDAFYPSLYCTYFSLPDGTHPLGTDQRHASEYRDKVQYYSDFIDLFDADRPVIAFIWQNYSLGGHNTYFEQEVNDLDLEMMLNEPWGKVYDGIALWADSDVQDGTDDINRFIHNRFTPRVWALQNSIE